MTRWLLQTTAILCKGSTASVSIQYLPIWVISLLLIVIVVLLRDSLLALALTYLLFSLGTEQYVSRGANLPLQFIFAFTAASLMLFTTAAVGVSTGQVSITNYADSPGSQVQEWTELGRCPGD